MQPVAARVVRGRPSSAAALSARTWPLLGDLQEAKAELWPVVVAARIARVEVREREAPREYEESRVIA